MINQQLNNSPNIIGISGKINCGKDLVGKIIQYLTTTNEYVLKNKPTFEDWMNNYSHHSNWEIKKFADSLKDIICILIGCTREQLEDREFKEKELGEEWWIKTITYIDGEKHTLMNPTSYEELDIKSKYPISCNIEIVKPTPRMLLQQIGTDLFRNQLHPNTWVNATMADYKPYGTIVGTYSDYKNGITKDFGGIDSLNNYPNWIITDVRFPNEADAIKDREGIIIRIERNDYIFDENGKRIIPTKEYINTNDKQHESETALDNYKFDYVINNNGTISNLVDKVKEILIKENKLL